MTSLPLCVCFKGLLKLVGFFGKKEAVVHGSPTLHKTVISFYCLSMTEKLPPVSCEEESSIQDSTSTVHDRLAKAGLVARQPRKKNYVDR